MTQKSLEPRQTSFDLSARFGYPAREVHLASVVGHCLPDREPQHCDPGGRSCDHRSLQPSLELPPDPVHDGPGGERSVSPPATLQRLAMFCLGLDEQLGGREPARRETTDKLFGKAHGDKGQGVRPVGGRIESPANREIYRRISESKLSLVETAGEPVGKASFGAKSGQYRRLVQIGKLTQRGNPQPSEHLGELGQAENLHRKVTEPLRCPRTGHYHSLAGRKPGHERPVRDTHLARRYRRRRAGCSRYSHDGLTGGITDLLGERGLSPEVTSGGPDRYGTSPWPGEFNSGGEGRDRYDNWFETPRVPRRFLAHNDKLWTACLRLPLALTKAHPFGSRKSRRGDHSVGKDDRGRPVGKPGGDEGPVGAPDDKGADRRHHTPFPGSRSRPRLGRLAAPRPPTSASSCRELSSP